MTVGERLHGAAAELKRRGVPEAQANAEILLARVLGVGRNEVFLRRGRELSPRESAAFSRLIRRRLRRIPMAHILGVQAFLDFELAAGPQALIPRPETEELAAAAMDALRQRREEPLRLWDLGTGTGCLAVALARFFPKASVLATDKSPAALGLARRNARANGVGARVHLRRDDFFAPRRGPRAWADLAVSNPPYIPSGSMPRLMPEVLREPRLALDGGKTGLDALAAVIERAAEALRPAGVAALEFGRGQARRVSALLLRRGFERVRILKDAQGLQRIALAAKSGANPARCRPLRVAR
ncbi:MAG: peptide chain release factor N(5)-glutamine methyltransferase [Elusimicrobia bacterium]|nr:peptide chain release factor N(5)-glutamine methyltransferase [Elusimicrobiota bacterium]MDE2312717.1 peptide chain release factor N(5)-glutamine methyltransferase [Elusimicrobiota bacterium]